MTLDYRGPAGATGSAGAAGAAGATGATGAAGSTYLFGTGLDGDVTISAGTTTLIRDMHYNNLTITGGILDTNGFRVFVAGTLDVSSASTQKGSITVSVGNQTANASAIAAAGGVAVNPASGPGTLPTAASPGSGKSSGTNSSTAGQSASSASIAAGGRGGSGGTGGAKGGGSALANGAAKPAAPTFSAQGIYTNFPAILGGSLSTWLVHGSIGGSGQGDSVNAGGGSGAPGSRGGIIWLAANIINRGASTHASVIYAPGQAAGAGAAGTAGTAGGGAGSGGGGGGWIYVIAGSLTGAQKAAALDASGGNGSAGGNGVSTGHGGDGGDGGNGGGIDLVVLSPPGYTTLAADTAGTAGGAASGATGGSAGTGGVAQLAL